VNYHNAKIEFQTQLLCEEIKKDKLQLGSNGHSELFEE
jgi:hypothetical protein